MPFCRGHDVAVEAEHDWAAMDRMGLRCDCVCHKGTGLLPEASEAPHITPPENGSRLQQYDGSACGESMGE